MGGGVEEGEFLPLAADDLHAHWQSGGAAADGDGGDGLSGDVKEDGVEQVGEELRAGLAIDVDGGGGGAVGEGGGGEDGAQPGIPTGEEGFAALDESFALLQDVLNDTRAEGGPGIEAALEGVGSAEASEERRNQAAQALHPGGLEEGVDRAEAGAGDIPGFIIIDAGVGALDGTAGLDELASEVIDEPARVFIEGGAAEIIRPGDAQPGESFGFWGNEGRGGGFGEDGQGEAQVVDGAGERAHAAELEEGLPSGRDGEALGAGEVAFAGYAPAGALEPVDAAEVGGDADGAADVAAELEEGQPGGDGCRRAAGAAAGGAGKVPGVVGAPEDGVIGLDAAGEGGQVGLAEDDGAGLAQAGDGGRIFLGDAVGEGGKPLTVRMPAVSKESLTVMGTPWRGPRGSPCRTASSAWAARRRAPSASRVMMALRAGLRAAMRARSASTSWREEV